MDSGFGPCFDRHHCLGWPEVCSGILVHQMHEAFAGKAAQNFTNGNGAHTAIRFGQGDRLQARPLGPLRPKRQRGAHPHELGEWPHWSIQGGGWHQHKGTPAPGTPAGQGERRQQQPAPSQPPSLQHCSLQGKEPGVGDAPRQGASQATAPWRAAAPQMEVRGNSGKATVTQCCCSVPCRPDLGSSRLQEAVIHLL